MPLIRKPKEPNYEEKPKSKLIKRVKVIDNRPKHGYTPQKGVDYFDGVTPTDEQLIELIQPLIPTVENGKDGVSPTTDELLALIRPLIPVVQNGETPSDERLIGLISQLLPTQITVGEVVDSINSQSDILEVNTIKGLKDVIDSRIPKQMIGSPRIKMLNNGQEMSSPLGSLNVVGGTITNKDQDYTIEMTGGGGGIETIVAGTNITVDNTDPANPIVSSLADRYKTTSTTSQAIVPTGTLTFTVDANLAYISQQDVIIVYDASNHMHGTVVSYSGTSLVVDIQHKTGSGTYALWTINLDGISAGVPTLQEVTDEGATTTNTVTVGGFGMAMAANTSSGTQTAFPSGLTRWDGGGAVTIQGIVAPTSGSLFAIIHNISAVQPLIIQHQSSFATATNRIITFSNTSVTVPVGRSAQLYYDTTSLRWRLHEISFIASTTSPLSVNGVGTLSVQNASASQTGVISAGDYTSFTNKWGGTPVAGAVPYFNTAISTLQANTIFGYSSSKVALGVGVTNGSQEATAHFKSDQPLTIADVSTASATLIQFDLPLAPTAVGYTTLTPDVATPSIGGTPSNLGAGAYVGGTVVDYVIRAGYDDGVTIYWGQSTSDITGITDATDFDIDVTISSGTENFTTNIWSISRQVDGAGYNDYVRTTSNFTDDNTVWTSGADTFDVYADDFVASGQTYVNNFYGTKTAPDSSVIVSSAYNADYADAGDNSTYKLEVDITGGDASPEYRVDWNGSDNYATASTIFTLTPSVLASGGAVTTPTTYGYTSDGSTLTRNYDFYTYQSIPLTFAVNPYNATTEDPSDGLNYYIQLTFSSTTGSVKCIRDSSVGQYASGTFFDDGVTPFADNTDVSPTASYTSAGLYESHGSTISDSATVTLRSLDGSYNRIDFLDNSNVREAYIEQTSGTLKLKSTNVILDGIINVPSASNNTIAGFDASENLVSLSTSTYPTLDELSRVKGVTSAIQTQINGKAPLASPIFTGKVRLPTYTVASLPTGVAGDTALVTDALAPAFGVAVAGGGTVGIPVYHDGTSWKVG